MEEAAMLFDKELCGALEDIMVGGGPLFGNLQWRLASLPIGFVLSIEASPYTFAASRAQSWVLQDHFFRDNGISGMDTHFDNASDGLRGTIPDFARTSSLLKHIIFW